MSIGTPSRPPVALTVAGFDPSTGAGITADLQVFAAHELYGTAAITALTVQSTRGVGAVQPVEPPLLRASLKELQADLPPAGIKIGMLGSAAVTHVMADFLLAVRKGGTSERSLPVVLDPVLRSSSGTDLMEAEGFELLRTVLLPLVDWITPNWLELACLSGMEVGSEEEAWAAMDRLGSRYPGLGVLATGGDQAEPVDCLRLPDGVRERMRGKHIATTSTHGTGCAFSSALLCGLTLGASASEAAAQAKRYVEGALRYAPGLGGGRGPLDLLWPMREAFRTVQNL